MIRGLLSLYSWKYPATLVYMLQNTEYQVGPYLKWYWHTIHFERVMYRRRLDRTGPARLLLLALRLGIFGQLVAGGILLLLGIDGQLTGGVEFGLATLISYPVVWAHLVVLPLELGRIFIIKPRQRYLIQKSKLMFSNVAGLKIAIAGSYGKTSMKELLLTVLKQGKKVAATPANKNVSVSHAYFVRKLDGDEDILLIEYGEGKPGDVKRFAKITRPTHAVITGLAPAHLDKYKTLKAVGKDIFSVADFVPGEDTYVNGESADALQFVRPGMQLYGEKGALGWRVSNVKIGLEGASFTMQKGSDKLELKSSLLGRHQVGPLAFAAALAHKFGLTKAQIKAGIAETKPFEHRMQPYQLGGAWIIDDTYNGNIDGIRAGTQLLKELPARRKIYVTPGLVDQGKQSPKIHREMGWLIAAAKPDMVVLVKHSVTNDIRKGLEEAGYSGELLIENDPLNFYQNLDLFVANGDLVMLQNDWPDNYS
jgi:UDP-N-acetylmuramoyl-tripeptide--D-alanyl-D-alanine ligase